MTMIIIKNKEEFKELFDEFVHTEANFYHETIGDFLEEINNEIEHEIRIKKHPLLKKLQKDLDKNRKMFDVRK
jgi:hypothetical protein